MTLRRKLLTLLTALATTALLLVAAGFWATSRQQAAHEELEDHLLRSLLLQRVDSTGRVLLRGQFAAVVADTPGARERFDALEKGIRDDLAQWATMSLSEDQAARRRAIEEAFDVAIAEIHATFALLDGGLQEEAFERLIDYDRRQPFAAFRDATAATLEAAQLERAAIRQRVERTRETVQLGLTIAAVAVLSLVFLFGAYLGGEVFRPLRDLNAALDAAAYGDRRSRLEEGRDDELGEVARSFNRLMDALEDDATGDDASGGVGLTGARAELQRRVVALDAWLRERESSQGGLDDEVSARLRQISETLERAIRFAAPTNLTMAPVDLARLVHDVMASFGDLLAARSVGVEIAIDPELEQIVADGPKLRAALLEIVRASIDSLPPRGGRVGFRAIGDPDDERWLLLEVVDDGTRGDPRRYERALAAQKGELDEAGNELAMAYDVIVSHGGRVEVDVTPGKLTRTMIRLPIR